MAPHSSPPSVLLKTPEDVESEEETASVTQGGIAIVKPDMAATKKTKRPRKEIVYHIVKPGDTVSTIAQVFEVSVNTILWENKLSAYSIIRPGDKLAILPVSGVTHTVKSGESLGSIAKKYNIGQEEIINNNKKKYLYSFFFNKEYDPNRRRNIAIKLNSLTNCFINLGRFNMKVSNRNKWR